MLGKVVSDAVGTLQAGEAAAIQGRPGRDADLQGGRAVMGAQRTLQQALAIRDKAVSRLSGNYPDDDLSFLRNQRIPS